MRFAAGPRKLVLAVHIAVSVGWIGALAAYLALDVATLASDDPATLRASYLGMERVALRAIVPLAVVAFATGILISIGTRWGLLRHYWVILSLALTALALVVLLVETRTVAALAEVARDPATTDETLRALPSTLPHSAGGLVVLLVVLALNVWKPRGVTPYGWRREREEMARGAVSGGAGAETPETR